MEPVILPKPIKFSGFWIRPCHWQKGLHSGQWYVEIYHSSGLPWADEECPHYGNIADAKIAISRMEPRVQDEWGRPLINIHAIMEKTLNVDNR
jgi:hypothetical protein